LIRPERKSKDFHWEALDIPILDVLQFYLFQSAKNECGLYLKRLWTNACTENHCWPNLDKKLKMGDSVFQVVNKSFTKKKKANFPKSHDRSELIPTLFPAKRFLMASKAASGTSAGRLQ